jgi:inosose dehydratase
VRVAAAPISWGVCEVPGWGWQLAAERVLDEARALGFTAIEAGPPGFLAGRPPLQLVGGFVAASELAAVEHQARWLREAGAEVLVFAAASSDEGYENRAEPDPDTWRAVAHAHDAARENHLTLAVHPHFGTRIETAAHVERLLHVTTAGLCLDTGHLLLGGVDPLALPVERVALVHLKDVDGALAERVRERRIGYREAVRRGLYRPLGDGDAGIRRTVRHLRDRGYGGWYVLEQDCVLASEPAPGAGPLLDVQRSVQFLRMI